MSLTTFPRFPELSFELRNTIWDYAIALYINDIPDRLPRWFDNSWADARLLNSVDWSKTLEYTEANLSVRILDPYDGLKLRFDEDEFETFVDCLAISGVCREARICVAKFCQPLVPHVSCDYYTKTGPLWSIKPPKNRARPVTIRNLHCQPETEALKYFFPRPTSLTMKMGAGEFKSAEHFVEIVFRFFGNRIQRLVLVQVVKSVVNINRAYWADSSVTPEDRTEIILKKYPEGDSTLMCMTRHGELHMSESFWQTGGHLPLHLIPHLRKINEIFNFSLEKLPYLEHIHVNLEVQGWEIEYSSIAMIYKKDVGVLAIISSDRVEWPTRGARFSIPSRSPSPSLSP